MATPITNTGIADILRGIGHTREAKAIVGYGHVNREARANPFSAGYRGTTYRTPPLRTIVRSLVAKFHGKRALAIMDAATVLDYHSHGGSWDDATMTERRQAKKFTPAERNTLRKALP